VLKNNSDFPPEAGKQAVVICIVDIRRGQMISEFRILNSKIFLISKFWYLPVRPQRSEGGISDFKIMSQSLTVSQSIPDSPLTFSTNHSALGTRNPQGFYFLLA